MRSSGALLKLGYRCNCACVFCHSAPHRGVDLSTEEALERIALAAAAGVERVVLSGGEPTIRADLVELVSHILRRGLVAGIVTNGRMLAYRGLREALLEAGLGQVYLSLHSHRPQVHNALVRCQGHRQALAAARWLAAEPGVDLLWNVVVTRSNLEDLPGVVRLAMGLAREGGRGQGDRPPMRLKLSLLEPEGAALEHYRRVVPRAQDSARAVARVLQRLSGSAAEAGVDLLVDGFPPCLLPEAAERSCDLWTEGFVYLMEAFEDRLHPIDDLARGRGEPCRRCSEDGCPGIYRTYLARHGDHELRAVVSPRGSAADFVDLGPVLGMDQAGSNHEDCPCFQGRLPHPDPRRELLLRLGDETRLHRCDGRDFREFELLRMVHQWGQIYLPTDPGEQAEDFGQSLEKLRPVKACSECPHRGACGGLWEHEERDVIAEGEARVKDFVAGLKGRVLDVGCGRAAYLLPLANAVKAGLVELHLLDPSPDAASALREDGLPHLLHGGGAEEAPAEAGPFDHALSVRSYSHFQDVDEAAQALARALRQGGQLTLVGDTPVALARSQAARDRSHGRQDLLLEHLRNHGPQEAWDLLSRHPFVLQRLEPPDPAGANLWWLEMLRR